MSGTFLPPSRAKIDETIGNRFRVWRQQLLEQDATPDIVLATGHSGPLRSEPTLCVCMPSDWAEGGGIDQTIDRVEAFLTILKNQRARFNQDILGGGYGGGGGGGGGDLFIPSPGLGG